VRLEVPQEVAPLDRISVTQLKHYLTCPTRFFFQHVLGMRHTEDTVLYPDAMAFGSLVHAVLQQLVQQEVSGETAWNQQTEQIVQANILETFGAPDGVALSVFARSAVARIQAAGRIHREMREAGWQTVALEQKLHRDCDGLEIRGILDRIDVHPEWGYRLIDYKTSDSADPPQKTHLGAVRPGRERFEVQVKGKTRRWTDLQLPAYRWLAEASPLIDADTPLTVGYIVLPKSVRNTGFQEWEEEKNLIPEARACIREVVREVREGIWGPPSEDVAYDDFAPLLHHGADWCWRKP
jgi:ATP-dependent helicase/nuclease subunit B